MTEGEVEVVGKEKEREKQITANKQKVAAFTSPKEGSAGHFSQLRMTFGSQGAGKAQHYT